MCGDSWQVTVLVQVQRRLDIHPVNINFYHHSHSKSWCTENVHTFTFTSSGLVVQCVLGRLRIEMCTLSVPISDLGGKGV